MSTVLSLTGVTAFYGAIHEKGGEFGGRHYQARPFMVPALRRCEAKFAAIFAKFKIWATGAGGSQ